MIGKGQWHKECQYSCCRSMIPKSTVKAQEKVAVRREIEQELSEDG
jgi:hypothetical protein